MTATGPERWAARCEAALAASTARPSVVIRGGGWALAVDAERQVPAASLIKLPILAAVAIAVDDGTIDLAESLPLPAAAHVGGAGVLAHLTPDQRWRLDDLAVLMVAVSDNTAANLLVERLGTERINATSRALGLTHTRLGTPLGETAGREADENVTSAQDVARLLRAVAGGSGLSPAAAGWMRSVLGAQQVRTKLAAGLPWQAPAGTLAHKTGEQPGVEHDAGILSAGGEAAVVVVCLTEVHDRAAARRAIAEIGDAVYRSLCEHGGDARTRGS